MSEYVTKTELKQFENRLDGRFDELLTVMGQFAQDVDSRFEAIDFRFERVELRFDTMEARIEARFERIENELRTLNEKYDHLVTTIDGFVGRIDNYETEMAARDRQMERLLTWARKVSEKTGIPLEDL